MPTSTYPALSQVEKKKKAGGEGKNSVLARPSSRRWRSSEHDTSPIGYLSRRYPSPPRHAKAFDIQIQGGSITVAAEIRGFANARHTVVHV
jgi:hypothetical protein